MFISPWERLPQKELGKSQTFCNIHCVIKSFVGHFTAGGWILISSMCSGAVPLGDLQVSSFDRVFKGPFALVAQTLSLHSVSQVCTKHTDKFPPSSKADYLH